jgi:hypothetical protein
VCWSVSRARDETSGVLDVACDAPTSTIVVIAYDGSSNIIATGLVRDVPFTGGQTATVTTWTPSAIDNFTASITGLAAPVTSLYLGAMQEIGGVISLQQSRYVTPTAGAASATFEVPPGGDRIYGYAQLYRDGQVGRQETYTKLAADASAATFTAPQLPWLGQVVFNSTAQVAQWIPIGTGGYDGAVADVNWGRYNPTTETNVQYHWTVAVPPHVSQWTWADPPAALAGYLPTETDNINGTIQLVDLSSAADYDQLRAAPEWQWECPGCATRAGELPSGSSIALPFDGGEGFHGFRPPAHR